VKNKSFTKTLAAVPVRAMSTLHPNHLTLTLTNRDFKEVYDNFDPSEKLIFLDVREDEDCEDGFVPDYNHDGVKVHLAHIPILDLIEMRTQPIDSYKDTHEILCYCRSGNKSATTTRILNLHGYTAYNVKGGIKALKKVMEIREQGKIRTFMLLTPYLVWYSVASLLSFFTDNLN
jgi:rhodanese-related sulfurtransferase